MLSRRQFVEVAALSGAAVLHPSLGRAVQVPRLAPRGAGRVLILGGTGFVGPHIVNALVNDGHTVSILTRGRREPGLHEEAFANVEHLIGDRAAADGLAALEGRSWDVVIETSGYRHTWTEAAVEALRGRAGGAVRVHLIDGGVLAVSQHGYRRGRPRAAERRPAG